MALAWRRRPAALVPLARHARQRDRLGRASAPPFPRPVAPGETIAVDVPLDAPRPPGRYVLRFDLVEEHRFWLSEVGVETLDVEVDVAPLIAERRLAVVVHGGPDPRTDGGARGAGGARRPDGLRRPPTSSRGRAGARLVAPAARRACRGLARRRPRDRPDGRAFERRRTARALRRWAPAGGTHGSTRRCFSRRSSKALAPGEHRGLPAYEGDGLFEGRAVVRLPTRSGRRPR